MNSTQIASNIREMSRLQFLVEVLQRVHSMLTKEDQTHYDEAFAAYTLGHAGQYVYHLKRQDTGEHLQKIGELMQRLLVELQLSYTKEPVYQMLERVFGEHFRVEERVLKTKVDKELSASSLQSPDDLEATYREKAKKSYKGYVAHFDTVVYQECPINQKGACPAQAGKRDPRFHVCFSRQQATLLATAEEPDPPERRTQLASCH